MEELRGRMPSPSESWISESSPKNVSNHCSLGSTNNSLSSMESSRNRSGEEDFKTSSDLVVWQDGLGNRGQGSVVRVQGGEDIFPPMSTLCIHFYPHDTEVMVHNQEG